MSRDPAAEDRLYDAAVVGAGPTGLAAALALNYVGAHVALIGPLPEARSEWRDTRTAALLAGSIDMLKAIGVWTGARAACRAAQGHPHHRRLATACSGRPRSIFEARELGLEAFGYNIPNTVLVETLYARARDALGAVVAANVKDLALE